MTNLVNSYGIGLRLNSRYLKESICPCESVHQELHSTSRIPLPNDLILYSSRPSGIPGLIHVYFVFRWVRIRRLKPEGCEEIMTKVIVAGATGFVGSNVVKQCIKDKTIKEVIVLTRKPIAESLSTNPKVNVIIHENFASLPDKVLQELLGSQGCIWSVTTTSTFFPLLNQTQDRWRKDQAIRRCRDGQEGWHWIYLCRSTSVQRLSGCVCCSTKAFQIRLL